MGWAKRIDIDDTCRIETITGIEELADYRHVLDSGVDKSSPHLPFLGYEWFRLWLKHFLGSDKLLMLVVYSGASLVGIAPLLLKQERVKGVKLRKLELMGNVYSPVRDFVTRRSSEREWAECFSSCLKCLAKYGGEWDVLELDCVPDQESRIPLIKNANLNTRVGLFPQNTGNIKSDDKPRKKVHPSITIEFMMES